MTDEEYARYSPWQQQMVAAEAAVSQAPAEVWVSFNEHDNGCQVTVGPAPDAVRYVRADLYDKRMAEPVNQEPLSQQELLRSASGEGRIARDNGVYHE